VEKLDLSGISAFSTPETRSYAAADTGGSQSSSSTSSNGLDMTDFFKLLAAQFANQDIMNPTDNTEYISELAQFASIQAMDTLTAYSDHQYAASLVGKTVQVRSVGSAGQTVYKTGVVSYADFSSSDGSSAIVVDDHAYGLGDVVQVLNDASAGDGTGDSGTDPTGGDSGDSGTDPVGGDDPGTGDGSSGT
jgi:flagellar basal-body rod modification protein FlgD